MYSLSPILKFFLSYFKISSLLWYSAWRESTFWMMDESEPVEKEKAMTPMIMIIEATILSAVFVALISP